MQVDVRVYVRGNFSGSLYLVKWHRQADGKQGKDSRRLVKCEIEKKSSEVVSDALILLMLQITGAEYHHRLY